MCADKCTSALHLHWGQEASDGILLRFMNCIFRCNRQKLLHCQSKHDSPLHCPIPLPLLSRLLIGQCFPSAFVSALIALIPAMHLCTIQHQFISWLWANFTSTIKKKWDLYLMLFTCDHIAQDRFFKPGGNTAWDESECWLTLFFLMSQYQRKGSEVVKWSGGCKRLVLVFYLIRKWEGGNAHLPT